jgi:hypothetical protein
MHSLDAQQDAAAVAAEGAAVQNKEGRGFSLMFIRWGGERPW